MTHRRQVKTLPVLREISEYFYTVKDNLTLRTFSVHFVAMAIVTLLSNTLPIVKAQRLLFSMSAEM